MNTRPIKPVLSSVHKLALAVMYSMAVIRISLFLSLLQCYVRVAKSESVLIIVLPQSNTEVSASWERGEEILPGALAAIEEAKNYQLSLNLRVIEANSGPIATFDLSYSGNVLEIIANLTWQKRVSLTDIIGIAGVLHPNVLAVLNKFQVPIVSLTDFNKIPLTSNIHYTTASVSTLTDSIIAFLKEIRPKKIGVITELKQPYLTVSYEFSTKADVPLHYQVIIEHHRISLLDINEGVFVSNAHAILLSVGPSTAISMLCEAYKRGLMWPKYAWILHSYRLDDLLRIRSFKSKVNGGCRVQKILEGIFIFQLTKESSSFASETTYLNFSHGAGHNPYAYLLHDSVWALISSSANTRSVSDFKEAPTPSQYSKSDSSKVYVYHNLNSTSSLVSIYDSTSHTLTNVNEIIFTDYELPIVNKEAFLVPYLLPLPVLSFIFNTILLVLYIVFRNEPSIKSTSVSFSMLMLIGCYFLAAYTVSLIVVEPYPLDFCMAHIWLSATGLSIPLICATILVKMLRVYHIFTSFQILKRSAHLSDCALLVYTILILLPNIILLILWTAIDPRYRVDSFTEHPGYIETELRCRSSNYELTWFALSLAYLFLLSAAVIIVAIKSRNIRLAQFKDTKKVNVLIFLLCIVGICMFSLWKVFRDLGFVLHSLFVLYAGHLLMAFLCQIILFVPKIWPAIQKKIIHHNCKHTGH